MSLSLSVLLPPSCLLSATAHSEHAVSGSGEATTLHYNLSNRTNPNSITIHPTPPTATRITTLFAPVSYSYSSPSLPYISLLPVHPTQQAACSPAPSSPPSSMANAASPASPAALLSSVPASSTKQPAQNPPPASPAAQFRPAPVRSFTAGVNPYLSSVQGRATSQPPGDRQPTSSPASGRGSPGGLNGGGPFGNEFGVIGGSRTPTGGKNGPAGAGTFVPTRASSFSVAEKIDQRVSGVFYYLPPGRVLTLSQPSALNRTLSSHLEERNSIMDRISSPSQFPTFSPTSSPATSPSAGQAGLPHANSGGQYSPPIAPANVSRSRSQSMATGVRPDRNFAPLTVNTFDSRASFKFDEPGSWRKDSSNMSPFTASVRPFGDSSDPSRNISMAENVGASFRTPQEATFGSRAAWKSPKTSALTTSVVNALGSQPSYSSVVGGFDDSANGGRSGASSRRHSVSVVGGGGARRGFSYNDGQGMSTISGRRGIGALGFSDEELLPDSFTNALNLSQIGDGKTAADAGEDAQVASSLPVFTPTREGLPRSNSRSNAPVDFFGSSPAGADKQERSKFNFERGRASFSMASGTSPGDVSGRPGPVGAPVRAPSATSANPGGAPGGGGLYDNRFSGPLPPAGYRGPFSNPPGPAPFGRPPSNFGFYGGMGQPPMGRPPFPQNGGFGGLGGFPPGPGFPGGPPPPHHQQPGGIGPGFFAPQPSNVPPPPPPQLRQSQPQSQPPPEQQNSPSSFSSLSLADLGKGIPLASLPHTTPLYIVTFKAGRRDVFYCPDPTLLISNGDRVIVEADRGSDLGTVVADQLTPVEVREWQERQATAALLSGASQHQPPGMAMGGGTSPVPAPPVTQHVRKGSHPVPVRPPAPGALDFSGADLNTLLSGVGPSGTQLDMGASGIGARGPLAKEIMPKRIFTKSSGGSEEQAYV